MRLLLFPCACLLFTPLLGQPPITYANLAPQGVAMAMSGLAEGASLPVLADGADQTWDLSGVAVHPLGTARFATAAGTPYANGFPQANRVFAQEFQGQGTIYEYVRTGPAGLELFGRGIPYLPVIYYQPSLILRFPLAFNESYTDSYVNENGANTRTWTYGGHGTAVTPLGVFHNVALVRNTQGHVILWNLEPLYPVLYNEEGSIYFFAMTGFVGDVGIGEEHAASLRAWPNPCSDRLSVEGARAGDAWQVVDMQGRRLMQGRMGDAAPVVDVRELASGAYVLLMGADGRARHVPFVKN